MAWYGYLPMSSQSDSNTIEVKKRFAPCSPVVFMVRSVALPLLLVLSRRRHHHLLRQIVQPSESSTMRKREASRLTTIFFVVPILHQLPLAQLLLDLIHLAAIPHLVASRLLLHLDQERPHLTLHQVVQALIIITLQMAFIQTVVILLPRTLIILPTIDQEHLLINSTTMAFLPRQISQPHLQLILIRRSLHHLLLIRTHLKMSQRASISSFM
jgi:hypothetical protein